MPESVSIPAVLKQAVPILLVGWLAVAASFLFPLPRPVDGLEGQVAFWWSESGKYGLPILILLTVGVICARPGLDPRRRRREALVQCVTLVFVIGAIAWANEFLLKRTLQVPRPNIARLAHAGELGGKTAPEFYALGDKPARRVFLREHLPSAPLGGPVLPDRIREHWIEETGYSFPSGHATAAMTFAAFFLATGLALLSGGRRWGILVVVPWGVGVCRSRPVLGVHSPTDVTVGGLQGVVLGLAGFALAEWARRRWALDASDSPGESAPPPSPSPSPSPSMA